MDMDPWPVREQVSEYETGWYRGGYDLVEQPDGTTKRYYWARLPPAVVVIARDGDELILVRQYRPTIQQYQLELPAGIVEEDESYTEAATRELQEETGFEAKTTELLQEVQVATGVLDHRRGYVFADDLAAGDRDLDGNEFLEVKRVTIETALEQVRDTPTNDASVMGLLLAQHDGYLPQ